MRIRPVQLTAIADGLHPEFVDDMQQHLRAHFPAELASLGDEPLRERVLESLERARDYELTRSDDLRRFLNLAAAFGWDFDRERPWVGEYLRDRSIPQPSERLNRVKSRLVRALRMDAENRRVRREFNG